MAWDQEELREPEVRFAFDGALETELRVSYAYQDIGGLRRYLCTHEGAMPAPTQRLEPGDVLRVGLTNDLPPNRDPALANSDRPHHFNSTNAHTHGHHVSPGGIGDNVLRTMEPGRRYEIEIAIPNDDPRGTCWYHPYHHGSADVQMSSGMAGALILEGDIADVAEIAAARERVLVLNEVIFDARGTIEEYDTV